MFLNTLFKTKSNSWLFLSRCVCRTVLLFKYQQKITRSPPIPPLQRKKVEETPVGPEVAHQGSFTLRSGRVIRTISAAPPLHCRNWTPPRPPPLTSEEDEKLGHQNTTAEVKKLFAFFYLWILIMLIVLDYLHL
jgi:hypothetical protein